MKNRKSPRIDEIPAELWKRAGDSGTKHWIRSLFITIPKKKETQQNVETTEQLF